MKGSHGIGKVPSWLGSEGVLPGLWVLGLMTLPEERLGNPLVVSRDGRQLGILSQFYMWLPED